MLELEAREKAISIIDDRRRYYCPMIRANCLIACECFKMPEVKNIWDAQDAPTDKDSWIVSYGYCTCHSLKGGSE
jgi:hypothetical protein